MVSKQKVEHVQNMMNYHIIMIMYMVRYNVFPYLWLPQQPYSGFQSALVVDNFLKGDMTSLQQNLEFAGYERTVEGAR